MDEQATKYQRAKKRVETLKGFYVHLGVYVTVNLLLFLINMIVSPDLLWFIWPLMGWGIAIVLHAFRVFGPGQRLGADWEERKIREIMENE